jgi:transcriptional regulator with XRE-family HTH domain
MLQMGESHGSENRAGTEVSLGERTSAELERAQLELGRLIREARIRLGVSQLGLARELGLAGGQSISWIESGQRPLPRKYARDMAAALAIPLDVLMSRVARVELAWLDLERERLEQKRESLRHGRCST